VDYSVKWLQRRTVREFDTSDSQFLQHTMFPPVHVIWRQSVLPGAKVVDLLRQVEVGCNRIAGRFTDEITLALAFPFIGENPYTITPRCRRCGSRLGRLSALDECFQRRVPTSLRRPFLKANQPGCSRRSTSFSKDCINK